MGAGFAAGAVGIIILFYAAYSTIQYRALLKITEEEFSGPPHERVVRIVSGIGILRLGCFDYPWRFPIDTAPF